VELYTDEPGFLFFTRRFNLGWEPQGREALFSMSYGPMDEEWFDFYCVVPDPRGDHRGRWHLDLALGGRPLLSAGTSSLGTHWSWRPKPVP
jgi:hypothetical protein